MSTELDTSVKNEKATTIMGLFVGKAMQLWPDKPSSAIQKVRINGAVKVLSSGLAGDEQADLRLHGGPEKVLHHYPAQHYKAWASELGDNPTVFRLGGFGENISASVFDEWNVCIADMFRIGTALIQVTQGRTPCWKLNRHTAIREMAADFVRTGRTGWYCRVLEQGEVRMDDILELTDRINPGWTVARVTKARLTSELDTALAREISQIPGISANWKVSFGRKAQKDFHEDVAAAWRDDQPADHVD